MSSGALPQSVANRLSTGVMFAFLGPFFGSIATLLFLAIAALFAPGSNWFAFLPFFIPIIGMGYVFGIGPALLCGIAYALMPGALQRLVLAPVYGAVSVWIFYEVVSFSTGGVRGEMSNNALMLFSGAAAALTCAWIARRQGWTTAHGSGALQP